MPDEKDESIGLSNMRESPLSAIFVAFRHGMLLTAMRLFLHLIHFGRCFRVSKRLLLKLRFSGERFAFQTREGLAAKRPVLGAIVIVIRSGIWPVLLSFLIVVVVYWFQFTITLPLVFRYIVESLAPKQVNWFTGPDGTTYITLLTTIAGTTGVFLALYFTTLSMVAISYSEPQQREIRNLVIENAISRGYISLLAHLGAICLFGLGFLAVGFPPSLLLMVYVLLVAGIAIFSFFVLGHHIFQLLDPRDLTSRPAANFLKCLKNATISGTRWEQIAFQRYFREQALYELHRIECLTEFAFVNPASGEIIRDLCISLLNLLSEYISDSRKIPSLSMWFPRKRVFQEWGFTSSIQTDIAMRTGTTPQPEEVPDYLFVCKSISRMVRRSLEGFLDRKDYSELTAVLFKVYQVSGKLGENLAIEEAQHLLREVRDVLFSDENGLRVIEKNDRAQAMSIASIYGTCLLNLAISASQSLESRSVEEILTAYMDLKSRGAKQLYHHGHPREILRHLEEFHQRLLFEQKTEGKICSSDWFLVEHVARRYADYIWGMSEQLVSSLNEYYIEPIEGLMKLGVVWTTAELLRSSIETIKKIGFRITAMAKLHEKLSAHAVTKEDWRPTDYTMLAKKLKGMEGELLQKVAHIGPQLASGVDVGEVPDYAGIFRAYIGDALVSKMATQEVNRFELLFDGFFKTTLEIVEHHIKKKDNHFLKPHTKIAFDTTLDLLDLSGLALLFSELHGSSFFDIVKKEWDAYFGECPDGKLAIEFFYGSISMALQLPVLSPSGTGRFNWERSFIRAMANAGFDIEGRMAQWQGEEKARTEHTSRIIQSIYPHMGMMFEHPYDYFAAFYLSGRPETAGIDLPDSAKNCKEDVERESRRRQEETGI